MVLLIVGRVVFGEEARASEEAARADGRRVEETKDATESIPDRRHGVSSRDATSQACAKFVVSAQPEPAEGTDVVIVPVKDLAKDPEKYRGRRVRVTGRLENIGKDYFRALQVVLKDGGHFIEVRPWLPSEFPPFPPGLPNVPPTMSDYLGKRVELTGVLKEVTGEESKQFYWLTVESARLL